MSELSAHGIGVAPLSEDVTMKQVCLSPGVEALAESETAPGCLVPQEAWRELRDDEVEGLRVKATRRPADSLYFLSVSGDLLETAQQSLLPLLTNRDTDTAPPREPRLDAFRQRLLSEIERGPGLASHAEAPKADLILHAPARRSTAFNRNIGRFMGLHIDNHQRLELARRGAADTLCSLNVGFADRYLNFVDLTVDDLLAMIADAGGQPPRDAHELKDRFFAEYPDYPVLRLTVPPGHAYLCKTQNVIHDGATPAGDLPDVSFMTMASFSPRDADD